jgi:hypothetical protein
MRHLPVVGALLPLSTSGCRNPRLAVIKTGKRQRAQRRSRPGEGSRTAEGSEEGRFRHLPVVGALLPLPSPEGTVRERAPDIWMPKSTLGGYKNRQKAEVAKKEQVRAVR